VAPRSDTRTVGKHEDEHLRRFLVARRRGDAREMRRWWDELVVDFFDRMDGFVAAAHRGRLDDEEHELAVELSMIRFSQRLITTFDGISIGQLVNACRTLATRICIDVQRKSVRRRRVEGPSLDSGWDADPDAHVTPAWEAREAARRHEAAERAAEAGAFLDWALPQVSEPRRHVLELSFHGAELPEIEAELGLTRDNAYQLRSRGMKDLKRLKERYDA
jgi:DNA-directed RNA polymerase specialized sigma24 family protein